MTEPRTAARSHRAGDVVMGDSGQFFLAEYDRFSRCLEWVPLLPIGASQPGPPADAVLVRRVVDGQPTAVTDFGDGELFAVRTVA